MGGTALPSDETPARASLRPSPTHIHEMLMFITDHISPVRNIPQATLHRVHPGPAEHVLAFTHHPGTRCKAGTWNSSRDTVGGVHIPRPSSGGTARAWRDRRLAGESLALNRGFWGCRTATRPW